MHTSLRRSLSPMLSLRFEMDDGHVLKLAPNEDGVLPLMPFGFEDLDSIYRGYGQLELHFSNARGSFSREAHGSGYWNGSASVDFHYRTTVFGLVAGGWLPSALVQATNLLIDRNVASFLAAHPHLLQAGATSSDEFWLAMLPMSAITVSPLLCALEGNKRRRPSFDEFCSEIENATEALSVALPGLSVDRYDTLRLKQGYSMVSGTYDDERANVAFLRKTNELVGQRKAIQELDATEKKLLDAAERLKPSALLAYLAVSCLYEPNGKSLLAARHLLKFTGQPYTQEQLYNVLFDVRQMLLLATAHTLVPGQRPALCTRDWGLAGAWAMLQPHDFHRIGNTVRFSLCAPPQAFVRKAERALPELLRRLELLSLNRGIGIAGDSLE